MHLFKTNLIIWFNIVIINKFSALFLLLFLIYILKVLLIVENLVGQEILPIVKV